MVSIRSVFGGKVSERNRILQQRAVKIFLNAQLFLFASKIVWAMLGRFQRKYVILQIKPIFL
jgi:hypothetical protein